jgi:hypothetical protein
LDSLNPTKNRDQIFSSGEASGASGSFFFFSHDKRFIVKTLTDAELKLKEKLLPDLYRHYSENPNSLISKVYGVYTVKMKNYKPVNLILMENTLKFANKKNITRVYDLKGSRTNRYVKTKNVLSSATLKDMNFLENKNYVQEINLSRKQKFSLRKIIQADT